MNGLICKPEMKRLDTNKHSNVSSRRIHWADSNYNRKDLCSSNIVRDLILQKEIKPINSHKVKKPLKPCLKTKINSHSMINDVKKSISMMAPIKMSESTNLQSNLNNYNTNNNALKDITSSSVNYGEISNSNKYSNDLLKNYTNMNINNIYPNNTIKSPSNYGIGSIKNEIDNNKMSKSMKLESSIKAADNTMNISLIKNNDNTHFNNKVGNNTSTNNYKPISNTNFGSNYDYSSTNQSNTRQNNFKTDTYSSDNSKIRSYSLADESNKNKYNSESNPANDPKIIIASKYQNIINNFNNIIIQSTDDLNKYKSNEYQNTQQNITRPNSLVKRDNNQQNLGNFYTNNYSSVNGSDLMNININPLKNIIPNKRFEPQNNQSSFKDSAINNSINIKESQEYLQKLQTRIIKDDQKLMQNNFLANNNQISNNSIE